MEVLTTETLAAAINYSPEYSHMGEDESSYLAEHILNFFGYSDRIIDNVLHPEDRDTFYMLEDAGLMETEREETTLYDGREWRIHYWKFKEGLREKVLAKMNDDTEEEETDPYADLYTDISDRIWRHGEDNSAPKGAFSKII